MSAPVDVFTNVGVRAGVDVGIADSESVGGRGERARVSLQNASAGTLTSASASVHILCTIRLH